jgi:hypothetical protein
MKCGEKYNPQHRCPKQVLLQVLEEVMQLFNVDESEGLLSDFGGQISEEELPRLSYCATVRI